jgi:hypothetical protein
VSQQSPQPESLPRGIIPRFIVGTPCGIVIGAAIWGAASREDGVPRVTWSHVGYEVLFGAVVGATLGAAIGLVCYLAVTSRWLFRWSQPSTRRRVRWTIAIVLGLLAAAYVAVFVWRLGKPFDAVEWRERESRHNGSRQQMADWVVVTHVLDGKTRAEVLSMLGNPNWPSFGGSLMFFLGKERSLLGPFGGPGCEWLTVDFGPDGRVSRYHIGALSNCGCVDTAE